MPIKIAVSGAHGVGKTTFCNDLRSALEQSDVVIHIVTEVARTLKAEGVPINRETQGSQYALFFERHVSNLFTNHTVDYVVYDRTILDSLAYAVVNGNLDLNWIRFIRTLSSIILKNIDVYCFIPIEFALSADGVRNTEAEYQRKLHNTLLDMVQGCRRDFAMVTGSRSERVRQVLRLLPPPYQASTVA